MQDVLRHYQSEAVRLTWSYVRGNLTNPVICLPTGGGKTMVIAKMIEDCVSWQKRVVVATHNQELLVQIENTLIRNNIPCGIVSSGLGRSDWHSDVAICGIQSVYSKADYLGMRDIVFIDECHRVSDDPESMYQRLLTELRNYQPALKVIGLTATPYRMDQGLICGKEKTFSDISYDISVARLINEGYLTKLSSKISGHSIDTSLLTIRGNDFAESDQELAFMAISDLIVRDMVDRCDRANRQSVLIFCAGVDQASDVKQKLANLGHVCGVVTGTTSDRDREEYITAFRQREIRFLVNCNVLTEGFDAPVVDCIVLLRATISPGLFYQMAGRGLRLHEGKEYSLVCDYGQNLERHGPIDDINPPANKSKNGKPKVIQCPSCEEAVKPSFEQCPRCDHILLGKPCPRCELENVKSAEACFSCGQIFKEPEPQDAWVKIDTQPSQEAALKGERSDIWIPVVKFKVKKHVSKHEGKLPTLRLDFLADIYGFQKPIHSEFLCVEHSGYARQKAEQFWKSFCGLQLPTTIDLAIVEFTARLSAGELNLPKVIQLQKDKKNPKYNRIKNMSSRKSHVPDSFLVKPETAVETSIPSVPLDANNYLSDWEIDTFYF